MINWQSLSLEKSFELLDSRPTGLTESEAVEKLAKFGPNQLQRRKQVSPIRLFFRQFANFFIDFSINF